MRTLAFKNIRIILPLFAILFMLGCSTTQTIHTTIKAQVERDRKSVRLITPEEIDMIDLTSNRVIVSKETEIVVLTSNRFNVLVYYAGLLFEMRLIVPAGEELFIKEPFAEVIDAETQQVLGTFHVNREVSADYNTGLTYDFSCSPVCEARDETIYEEIREYNGRLIGLVSLSPATVYGTGIILDLDNVNEFVLKFPIFRTVGNEKIIFENVAFKVSTKTVYNVLEWYWDDFLMVFSVPGF